MKIGREWTLASPNLLLIPGMVSQTVSTLPSALMALVNNLFLYFFLLLEHQCFKMDHSLQETAASYESINQRLERFFILVTIN